MPLAASDLALSIKISQNCAHDEAVYALTERISGKLTMGLADCVSTAFAQLRTDIRNRKLYVMFEQALACDPKTDHEAPKDVYPIYRPFVDAAELRLINDGMGSMKERLIGELKEHLISYIRAHEELKSQYDAMIKKNYALAQQIEELTEFLRSLLVEKAGATRRNQLKIHELFCTIAGHGRTGSITMPTDYEGFMLRESVPNTQNKEAFEQLQRDIESKNLTIAALRNQIQTLSGQLTESRARVRDIMTRSFSHQPLDVHTTAPYIAQNKQEISSQKGFVETDAAETPCDSDIEVINGNSIMLSLVSTPRTTRGTTRAALDVSSEAQRPSESFAGKVHEETQDGDAGRQSCVPAPFKFSSPILRRMQKDQRGSILVKREEAPVAFEPISIEAKVMPLLQSDLSLKMRGRAGSHDGSTLGGVGPLSSRSILKRQVPASPRVLPAVRESSDESLHKTHLGIVSRADSVKHLHDAKNEAGVTSCSYSDEAPSCILSACSHTNEHCSGSKVECEIRGTCEVATNTDMVPMPTPETKNRAIQVSPAAGDDSDKLWTSVKVSLKLLVSEWTAMNLRRPKYKSFAVQCTPDLSECSQHVFSMNMAQVRELLRIREIENSLRKILKKRGPNLAALMQSTALSPFNSSIEGFNDIDTDADVLIDTDVSSGSGSDADTDADIEAVIKKAHYSSILGEPTTDKTQSTIVAKPVLTAQSAKKTISKFCPASGQVRRPLAQSAASPTRQRVNMSGKSVYQGVIGSPRERASPCRGNNFFSARPFLHQLNSIQRTNSSESKLICKRTIQSLNITGLTREVD